MRKGLKIKIFFSIICVIFYIFIYLSYFNNVIFTLITGVLLQLLRSLTLRSLGGYLSSEENWGNGLRNSCLLIVKNEPNRRCFEQFLLNYTILVIVTLFYLNIFLVST